MSTSGFHGSSNNINPWRILYKSLLLFLVFNLLFVVWSPVWLGKISLYNSLFPGRERFPFGEDSTQSYNISLFNLDAMFASHIIAGTSTVSNDYRVLIIGDSSTWGTLLRPEETLAGKLDSANLTLCGRNVRVYNLGYPTISLTKDLMVLEYALRYHPNLIIWPVTLEAFPVDVQLTSPIVANNTALVDDLITRYNLSLNPRDPDLVQADLWDRTIIGQRRSLADLLRLQMYGILWAATGIDQVYPDNYTHAQVDFATDITFHGMQPPTQIESQMAFDVLEAGLNAAGKTPVILVNEPILISTGKNSNLRYNFYYPRWAYDQYRSMMSTRAEQEGWQYVDLWNLIPPDQFTNSAIHLTPAGESVMAQQIKNVILRENCP